ncbi:cytidine deaminase-like protein [Dacryopinax primogenitus]|uniref:Cytidine deaminase-like protein n=1 Tax=Dacryopinax primogenitus (strain DJM 731) TaxID=1858805 RepID=M5GGU1_DACPD|nr:cytidine deaminase-like protein [Dacryopinax primogenitus]EJU06078.1 cytidine deaminase-like protein [Dacryopinax primogenitus]
MCSPSQQSQPSPFTSPTQTPPSPQYETDMHYINLALAQAREALDAGEVPVGCVFVDSEGEVVASARNRTNELRNATRHAELEAIDHLLSSPSLSLPRPHPLSSLTLYVTVEPCIMCSSALRQLEISRVVYGCSNPRFGGCGGVWAVNELPHPRERAYEALEGYGREEAILLLRRFYMTENIKAPTPKSKARRVLKTDIPPMRTPTPGS